MKEIKDWSDINFTVLFEKESDIPALDFKVFEITARTKDEKTGEYTVPNYEIEGAVSSEELTEKIEEAKSYFRGHIKWDACSHVYFGDEGGYLHLCGGMSWKNLMEVMRRVWEYACEKLPEEHSKDMFDLEYEPNKI